VKTSQEEAFLAGEADAWIRRNPDSTTLPADDDPVVAAIASCELPPQGTLIDAGGAAGRHAAAFLRDHPGWTVRVIDPSGEAIEAGRRAFPGVLFDQGTITRPLPAASEERSTYDVVVVAGVLCWIDRSLLSHAIANADAALADGGLLVLADYDPPSQRANPYVHRPGLFTYKQDYAQCFLALGTYHLVRRHSFLYDSAANPSDPYDRQWMTAVLRKDLSGRYVRP
jgi:SAM-dependent methyltransferase